MPAARHIAVALTAVMMSVGCTPQPTDDPSVGCTPQPTNGPDDGRCPDSPLLQMHQKAAGIFGSREGFGKVRVYTRNDITPFEANRVSGDSWIKVHAVYPQTINGYLYE